MEDKKTTGANSMISKALDILELLAKQTAGLTLQEMVGLLNYPKSTIYKIATNLYQLGYLGRESDSLRYFLSRKMLSVGLSAVSGYDIIERSEGHMRQLRDAIGESVMIGTLIDNEAVLLNQVQGNLDFVFTLKQGMRFNLHSTAPGKVFLAYLPQWERNEKLRTMRLEAINEYTITDKSVLGKELDKIMRDGYAADLNETVQGVHCIAAPIFDESNKIIACVWTSGPAGRIAERVKVVAREVMDCGLAISHNIGYQKKK